MGGWCVYIVTMYSMGCVCLCVCGVCDGVFLVAGYVPLSRTKIDFSSDLEKTDPNQKKKKKKKVRNTHSRNVHSG